MTALAAAGIPANVRALAAGALLVAPWLNPFAPGPSAAAGPLMVSWLCAAWALGLGAGRDPLLVARAWLAAAGISACFGLLQYFGMVELAGGWVNYTEPGTAYGNLRQRNQFATLMSIGTVAALYLASSRAAWPRAAACAAIVLLALANAAAASRTGALQLAAILALCLAWPGPQRKPNAALALAGVAAYTVGTLGLPWVLEALTGHAAPGLFGRVAGGAACSSRLVLWDNVLYLVAQRPWSGWGAGELDYAHYATLYDGLRFCDILDNAHNLPLHVAVEFGLPVTLAIFGAIGWMTWRMAPWRESDDARRMAWSVILLIALHSLVEYPLWYGPFQLALVLCVLLLWKRAELTPPLRFLARVAAFALVPALIAYAAWDYRRVSQLYLPPEERLARYRDDPMAHARASWLFARQVRFAELSITPLTRANAAAHHELALDMLHFSPEPKVIEAVIGSALQLHDEPAVAWHMLRYRAAFPEAYAEWRAKVSAP